MPSLLLLCIIPILRNNVTGNNLTGQEAQAGSANCSSFGALQADCSICSICIIVANAEQYEEPAPQCTFSWLRSTKSISQFLLRSGATKRRARNVLTRYGAQSSQHATGLFSIIVGKYCQDEKAPLRTTAVWSASK